MVQSVLGSLTLGYRPLWGIHRQCVGVQLFVSDDPQAAMIDTPHLLRTLQALWSASSPPLLIAPQSRQLLYHLLSSAPAGCPWIEVRGQWLSDSALFALVQAAHQRGVPMVWRGELAQLPPGDIARCFDNSLLSLSVQEAILALQSTSAQHARTTIPPKSPVLDGQMYENLPTMALVAHCLDAHRAVAIAGWPGDDLLYRQRHQSVQPAHGVILRLMKAIDAEQSLDAFEHILGEDPLLAYRFMVFNNSAALGLRSGVDSLRRGLVMMGYGQLQRWLAEQLPSASTDPNLEPLRLAAVLRARLCERLVEAGIEYELRRQIYLMGLLSGIGDWLNEPTGNALRRLPLSEHIVEAIIEGTGLYAPSLQLACALEGENADGVRQLCETHGLDKEDANRVLLRVLSELSVQRPHPPAQGGAQMLEF